MLDWRKESLLTLPKLAERLGKTYRQVWSWATAGLKAVDGTRVKLEVRKLECWHTTEEAFDRFFAALNPEEKQTVKPRSPAEQKRGARRAAEKLKARGY